MRGDALLDALEGIDARYIEEAAALPKKRAAVWLRVLSVAACVCLVIGAVGGVAWWRTVPRSPMDNTLIGVSENGKAPSAFGSLDELITARADGESHPNRADSFLLSASVQTTVDQMIELQQAVVHESVAYHVSEDGVQMSVLSESPLVSSLVLQGNFDGLLYTGQHLITVQSLDKPSEKPLSTVYATKVTVYAFGSSHNLMQVHEWTQAGELSEVFLHGNELVLMTTDGQCACGWPRTKTREDYVPQLTVNTMPIAWEDDGMSILGNPRVVQYLAMSRIDISSAEVIDRHAFYGTVINIWYGSDWLALYCYDDDPLVYTFDLGGAVRCTGTIDTPDKTFAQVSVQSVDKHKDIYRVVGTYRTGRGGNTNVQLLAMTAHMKKGMLCYETRGFEQDCAWSAQSVVWEDDRAVTEAAFWSLKEEFNRLLFVEFRGMNMRLFVSETAPKATPVARDNTIAGDEDPQHLIALSGGYYLRYNAAMTGLDVWDLSSSDNPQCVYLSQGDIVDGMMTYCCYVYDKQTVGVQVIYPDENGRYRDVTASWNIYRVNPRDDTPLVLISSTPLGTGAVSNEEFAVFSYEGVSYVVTRRMTVPIRIQ